MQTKRFGENCQPLAALLPAFHFPLAVRRRCLRLGLTCGGFSFVNGDHIVVLGTAVLGPHLSGRPQLHPRCRKEGFPDKELVSQDARQPFRRHAFQVGDRFHSIDLQHDAISDYRIVAAPGLPFETVVEKFGMHACSCKPRPRLTPHLGILRPKRLQPVGERVRLPPACEHPPKRSGKSRQGRL